MNKNYLILIFLSSLLAKDQPSITHIIERADREYNQVKDFEATMSVNLTVPGFRMPKKTYKVYFKSPNKIKIKTNGFGVLPKTGLFTSPKDNFDNLKNLELILKNNPTNCILISGIVIPDSLKVQFPNEYAKLTFNPYVDVVIDTSRWVIQSVTTRIDTVKLFEIKNYYKIFDKKYFMPVQSQIEYYIKDANLANWLNNDFNGMMKMGNKLNKKTDVVQGTIKVLYSKYKINRGIPDRIFKKRPE
ncbi:MAG: hypothetical protein ACKVLE_03015 [Fidelibacterota bacterium]|jgi:hypothetical protein|tara:strand:+ start:3761 stop:4495 length:735 start_codon:yes stop_codon:yes gene_type:complete